MKRDMVNASDESNKEPRPVENVFAFFHYLSKDIGMGGQVKIPLDPNLWPDDWKRVSYKKYETTQKIQLVSHEKSALKISLVEALGKRKSSRDFKSAEHFVTLDDLAYILKQSVRVKSAEDQNSGRHYPSPGGLYPCEVYVFVSRGKDIQRGFYHYNFLEHSLELLTSLGDGDKIFLDAQKFSTEASFAIIITIVTSRILPKYGERGYRYGLIEAGHIGQNICLVATSMDLKHCPCGGIYETQVEKYLKIDGRGEVAVYAIYIS
jgi:SagB-type dehydrogenase family enzyme